MEIEGSTEKKKRNSYSLQFKMETVKQI